MSPSMGTFSSAVRHKSVMLQIEGSDISMEYFISYVNISNTEFLSTFRSSCDKMSCDKMVCVQMSL